MAVVYYLIIFAVMMLAGVVFQRRANPAAGCKQT